MKEQSHLLNEEQNGLRFGNYDLVRRIDVGGMGEVYLARQRTAFGREVAVKIIRPDLVHDITIRKRFLREAEVNAHLKHDHILPLIEFSEHEGRLFLVTPYIQGGTLAPRLQNGPLSLTELHQLFSALVQAIAYVHKRGVVHRDLKPSNILLDYEEGSDQVYVRLIDFGIATIPGMPASAPLTTAGNEIGTAAYMAPERLDGIAAPSNDIYSLGVILFQMYTGMLPSKETLSQLPPPLEYVVRRCIIPNPADRFASADELLQAFERAYHVMSVAARFHPEGSAHEHPSENITPRRTSGPVSRDNLLFHRGEVVASSHIKADGGFNKADYNAPTSFIEPSRVEQKHLADEAMLLTSPQASHKTRKRSLVGIISVAIVALIVTMAGMGYMAFEASISANVTITPQTQTVSKVFIVTAKPTQQNVDATTASLPATVLNSSKTGSQQGPTTGVAGCVLGIFECKQAVSFFDVAALEIQIRPTVKKQIDQDLQQQAQTGGLTTVGSARYTDGNVAADPQVGTVSKTVSVTLTEQGSIEGIKTKDVQSLASQLLSQQVPPHYVLMNQLTRVGQPVMQEVDGNGNVKIAIAAGGVAHYQFFPQDLTSIQNHIKGMKLKNARAYIATLPGLDSNAIGIHLSFGDTIPDNVKQIKVTTVDPTNPPTVQLPAIPNQ